MKHDRTSRRALLAASALCCTLLAPHVRAQAAADAPPTVASTSQEEAIQLSPFVVESTEDQGYSARDTLAGSRVRTELRDVGSAVSVVTQQFLADTNSRNASDLLVYTTGTEVAGQGGNFLGQGDTAILDSTANTNPNPTTRVRGLAQADNLRDFFLTDIPWDSYNVGRVDLQRGPNSILFGIGSPAGIINSSLNAASFQNARQVEVQFGSFGSYRFSGDLNEVVLPQELAVRVAGLYDNTKYKQKPAFRDDHRMYAALRYDPKFFRVNGARTSLRANFEKGNIGANYPRQTPPMDGITPWFTSLNKQTFTYQDSNQLTTFGDPSGRYNPWLGSAGNRIYDGLVTTFDNRDASTQSGIFAANVQNYPTNSDTTTNNTVNGSYKGINLYNSYAFNARLPGYIIQPYKAKSLTDPSVFDFYNNLIDGPNKYNGTKFKAWDINLSQTFFNDRLGFELVYDKQDTSWWYRNFISGDAATITVDVMSTFMNGSANPNVGRAMIVGGGGSAGSGWNRNVRDNRRGTVFGELDFKDITDNSLLATILGKHRFTYSAMRQSTESESRNWANWYVGAGYGPVANIAVGQAGRDDTTITYLSGNLSSRSSASGLGLGRITAVQEPASGTVTQWDTTTKSFVSYPVPVVNANSDQYNFDTRPYTQASHRLEEINSQTAVWQGYLFGGNLVPMIGWRKDTDESFDAGTPDKTLGIVTGLDNPNWRLPYDQADAANGRTYAIVNGQTHTYSIVAHVPKSLMSKLPGQLGFSVFYNKSQNFQPAASRLDILGHHIPSPQGDTKDYGFAISALDEKITLKVNRYETRVTNATLNGALGNAYLIGAGEAWGTHAAVELANNTGNYPGDGNFGTTSSASKYGAGHILRWQPADTPANLLDPSKPGSNYTQAAIDAQYDIQRASTDDWMAHLVDADFQQAWGLGSKYGQLGYDGSWSMNTVAVTGDTLSKGTEFELVANPIPGLNVSINASKTDAQRLNIAKAYSDWIDKRWADYQGPMGDMRLWGNGNWALTEGAGGTVRDKFNNEVMPNYLLAKALNGSSVPELRPWRYNAIANYAFQNGSLKGANVGMGYRWEDKQVVGFKLGTDQRSYDVNQRIYGPIEQHFDFWVGYSRKLPWNGVKWRIQLNIRNAFEGNKLIPVTVQPDGSPGTFRIGEPRTFSLTNTFDF